MPYRLVPEAKLDLDDLYLYGVRAFGVTAADRYLLELLDIFELLSTMPRMGRDIGEGMRASVHRVHIVVYRLGEGDTVEIVRVMDARSNWREHLG